MKKLVVLAAAVLLPMSLAAAGSTHHTALATTTITVNGGGGDRVYDGVGAILGGGGNARYLEDYPAAQRAQIMNYLFEPGYGASLQLLKLEIGGDANSSAGAEPSIEHTQGTINCGAGWEFDIAKQAVALNPNLKLYGLQWGAPGWVGGTGPDGPTLFTAADRQYLIDWLNCARQNGLTISYLGGWNERDKGDNATWFGDLRQDLNANGYQNVQIVAGDSSGWNYTTGSDVSILGVHDNCGYPTGTDGPNTVCSSSAAAQSSGKPLWGSELGAMDAGAQTGCKIPCAPAMDRAWAREYLANQTTGAKVTGVLEWPAIDSMPADVLPYENRGLLTADQPWSGSYSVNAMTWAIAQMTQFVWPPRPTNPGGWKFEDSSSGYLQGNKADGSYDTLIRSGGTDWSTIIEATTASAAQQVTFDVTGGAGLAGMTVHEWSSNFNFNTDSPSQWFVQQPDITPVNGKFTVTIQPGYVYSFTTTTGQGHGTVTGPAPSALQLPYSNDLSSGSDGEPAMLDAQDGSFELAHCTAPDGSTTCTEQTTVGQPVLWQVANAATRHPFAIIGSDWSNYVVSADVMVPQSGSAGLIGRYHAVNAAQGTFDGYVFDVNTNGTYTLTVNSGGAAAYTQSGQRQLAAPRRTVLAQGKIPRGKAGRGKVARGQAARSRAPFAAGTWHTLSLSISGPNILASIDGTSVAMASDGTLTDGMPGIEVGGWYPGYFSNLSVSLPPP